MLSVGYSELVKDLTNFEAIEQSMTVNRRRQNVRSLRELADLQACDRRDLSLIPTLEVIEEHGTEATVGTVAVTLGLDPSRASRLVSAAIRARYVSRVASQSDGRRVHLELTAAGNGFVKYAHRYRQDLIRRAMEDWTESDRGQLAVLLARFTDALQATASTD